LPTIVRTERGNQLPPEFRRHYSKVEHIKDSVGRVAIWATVKGINKPVRLTKAEYEKAKKKKTLSVRRQDSGGSAGGVSGDQASLNDRISKLEKKLDKSRKKNRKKFKELEKKNQRILDEKENIHNRLGALLLGDLPVERIANDSKTDSKPRRYWNKSTGWVGSKWPKRWQSEPSATTRQIEERTSGPVVIEKYETIDGYSVEDRRRGLTMALGTLVVVGIAILGAGLWGKHEESEGAHSQAAKITMLQHNNHVLRSEDREDDNAIRRLMNQPAKEESKEAARPNTAHYKLVQEFYVEPGNGITNEIQDYAAAHGYDRVSGSQAWIIYENMRAKFGEDLVDLPTGADDTYIRQQGDVGISQPGEAIWPHEVESYLTQRLSR
jgi:hypothetical protein